MKKTLLFALSALMLSGCSFLRQPEYLSSSVLDFAKYTNDGFFISESNSVSFEYKPLGSVLALNLSGYEVATTTEKKGSDDVYYADYKTLSTKTTNKYKRASEAKVLEEMVRKAKLIGANGIVNLKFEPHFSTTQGITLLIGYSGTAMAIKK